MQERSGYLRIHDDFQFVVELPAVPPLQVIVLRLAVLLLAVREVRLNVVIIPSRILQGAVPIGERGRTVTLVLAAGFKSIVSQL